MTSRSEALKALETPAPPTKQAKYRRAQKTPGKTPENPQSQAAKLLTQQGVPPSLAARLVEQYATPQARADALLQWTGRCALSGLTLSDDIPALVPIAREDGTFICALVSEHKGALSDTAWLQLCRQCAGQPHIPSRPAPALVERQYTAPEGHQHDQILGMELRDQDERAEVAHWPADAAGTAGPSHGGRDALDRLVDNFVSRYA